MNPTPSLSRRGVDRASHRRADEQWLAAAWADEDSRVVVVQDGRAPVVEAPDGPHLALVPPSQAPEGERYLLGEHDGRAYFAVSGLAPPVGDRLAGLREVGAELDDVDSGLLVHAVGLANWHATHTHCPRCGAPTAVTAAGHTRRCTADGSSHFPRTDPAVIMLVHDGGDRALLGRQPSWPPRRFSTLAGFVEPGESAELAVAREVAEETGVEVSDIRYVSSQPWPFPASLMLGFTARAVTEEVRLADGELDDAGWFHRDELLEGRGVLLPPPVSVAYRLIAGWLGAEPSGRTAPRWT